MEADRSLEEKTLIDSVTFFQKEGIGECTHPSRHRKGRDYTISAVMPHKIFRVLGSN